MDCEYELYVSRIIHKFQRQNPVTKILGRVLKMLKKKIRSLVIFWLENRRKRIARIDWITARG